jgi:HD-GYP domain-containing protein (c-di-GMP phosphodiesterase class II)
MTSSEKTGNLFKLVTALSEAMDLVSPVVADHHVRTAWFAVNLARKMGFNENEIRRILFSALLHDIGAFSLKERLDTLNFEFENPHHHACLGFQLLHDFRPFEKEAKIILAHHTWWEPESENEVGGTQVPAASHVIHLADRIAILIEEDCNVIERSDDIIGLILSQSGTMFMPLAVEALLDFSGDERFWFDVFKPELLDCLQLKVNSCELRLDVGDLENIAHVFGKIIDYRSPFTATHSAGVAAVAEVLAHILGFSQENCRIIKVAGYLHDLGKLAVATELLEKSDHLDQREYIHVQHHALHTHRLLEKVPDLGYGITWASQHHERLDGSGYPDHSAAGDIAFGSRVIAVADIYTAITEDRPYRAGVPGNEALVELKHLTDEGYLDGEVFQALTSNYEELDIIRIQAQSAAMEDYSERVGPFLQKGDECGRGMN